MGLSFVVRLLALALVLTSALMALGARDAAADVSAGPLTFGLPQQIDAQPPYGSHDFVNAISCAPGSTMCAVVGFLGGPLDPEGSVVTISTNASAAHPTWTQSTTLITSLTGISCPTTSLCVAGIDTSSRYNPTGTGGVLISTDPTAADPSWQEADIDPDIGIDDVSCPSTKLCVAVDGDGNVLISTDPTAANPKWSTTNVEGSELGLISCPSTSLCVATDFSGSVVTTTDPTAATPTWSAPTNIDGMNQDQSLSGLSCSSNSLCVAVDTAGHAIISDSPADPAPKWSAPRTIDGQRALGISCAGTRLCVADDGANVIATTDPTANVPTWTATANVDSEVMVSLSCPSSRLCVADDQLGGATTSTDPGDPSQTWSPRADIAGSNSLLALSCPTTTFCAATDNDGRALTSTDPAAPTPAWTRTATALPAGFLASFISCSTSALCVGFNGAGAGVTSTNPTDPTPTWTLSYPISMDSEAEEEVTGLSCTSVALCAVVTSKGRVSISSDPAGAGTWGGPWTIDSTTAPGGQLTGISCLSTALCVAVDGSGHVVISTDPGAGTPAWSAPVSIDSNGDLVGVSCPSTKLCVAVDGFGHAVVTTDPTDPAPTWTISSKLDNQWPLEGVSCPAETLCVAFDLNGSVLTTTDPTAPVPTWSEPVPLGSPLSALACAAGGLCVGVGGDQAIGAIAPALTVSLAGTGSGSVVGTGIDCPSNCAAPYPSGTAVTLTATPASGSTFDGWSGGGCSGSGTCITTVAGADGVTATFTAIPTPTPPPNPTPPPVAPSVPTSPPPHVAAPVNLNRPTITGRRQVGQTLTCAPGSWSNAAAGFADTWIRNGTPLFGATGSTYRLRQLDQGTTIVCAVTARNVAGSASARSAAIEISVSPVRRCPRATGRLSGRRLGLVRLGMSRRQVRRAYAGHRRRSGSFRDVVCATAAGIEVGYPNAALLQRLGKHARAQLQGTAVWASTANPFYALEGIRTGAAGADAIARLRPTARVRSGHSTWYLARRGGVTSLVEIRRGAVVELAIAASSLTADAGHRSALLRSMS